MKESFELVEQFPASKAVIYEMWLSSEGHSKMTGGEADCSSEPGATFTAWDGYISGSNISLIENTEIVQKWRTSEFSEDDEDSILTIRLTDTDDGCEMVLVHGNLPEGQTQYEQGWTDHYFNPMKEHFSA